MSNEGPSLGATSNDPAPTPTGLPTAQPVGNEAFSGDPPSQAGSSNPPEEPTRFRSTVDVNSAEEAERQRKWHEERIESRLRGEYERNARRLSEIVNEKKDSKLRLNAIRFEGSENTRAGFLARICEPYLAPPAGSVDESITLQQLIRRSKRLSSQLSRFDIFSDVQVQLEDSKGIFAQDGDVDLVMNVKESSRLFAKLSTEIGNGEWGSAGGTARIRNAFGGGELIEGNASFGTTTKSNYQLKFDAPVLADPSKRAELVGFATDRDLTLSASCRESLQGAQARLKTTSRFGYHELAYEAVARHLHSFEPYASISMRKAAGHTLKSALSHSFISDTRNDPFVATRGRYLRLMQEYAGLGGDANHVKLEMESQISRAVHPGYSLSFAFRSGCLLPLFDKPSLFSDRFQLGGPSSIRSFKQNHLGPKDNGDYLGGDLQYAAGLSLLTPFPFKPHWPVNGHLFLNGGNLVSWDTTKGRLDTITRLIAEPSVSAGVGLIYRQSGVRFEANVGVPLIAHKSDGARTGFQIGIGLSFL